jgi:hypothetical protein
MLFVCSGAVAVVLVVLVVLVDSSYLAFLPVEPGGVAALSSVSLFNEGRMGDTKSTSMSTH